VAPAQAQLCGGEQAAIAPPQLAVALAQLGAG